MRRFAASLVFLTLVLGLFALPGAAEAGRGWVKLGQRTVTDRADHDTIWVGDERTDFRSLKIEVERRAVQFHKVVVRFGNGERQEIELRNVIPAGGESRVIDLDGFDRVIRSIDLWYDAQSIRGKRAVVKVWAHR